MQEHRICESCGRDYVAWRRDQRFCSRRCKDQWRNDHKPRLTAKSYRRAAEARNLRLSDTQRQVVLGGLLGDGSIIPSTRFHSYRLCHGEKQLAYLEWKRQLLGWLIQSAHPSRAANRKGTVQYHYQSIAHPELSGIFHLVYRSGKKVATMEWLEQIGPLGLCVWYLDDGSFNRNPNSRQIMLCTDGFGPHGNLVIAEWLRDRFGIPTHLQRVVAATKFRPAKEYYRLVINRGHVAPFLSLFAHMIPDCMRYKLPSDLPC